MNLVGTLSHLWDSSKESMESHGLGDRYRDEVSPNRALGDRQRLLHRVSVLLNQDLFSLPVVQYPPFTTRILFVFSLIIVSLLNLILFDFNFIYLNN